MREEAARDKHIVSPVAGRGYILLVPDLEAGNSLAEQLTSMSNAGAASIMLDAGLSIMLTSSADSLRSRMA